jgi:Zn-dependent membrane protease YugP
MVFDPLYLIILGIGALLSIGAQIWVKSKVNKWKDVRTSRGMSGRDVAQAILSAEGIRDVRIEPVKGFLSDHYDPSEKVLRLSPDIYNGRSVSAAGIAAHEVGHAIQDAHGYWPMAMRQKMVPVANIGTNLGLWITIIGLVIGATGLATVGVFLFGGFVAFTLVTLPVEFNASMRARRILEDHGLLGGQELQGVNEVLIAAAATYVAAAAGAILQFLYWASMVFGRQE